MSSGRQGIIGGRPVLAHEPQVADHRFEELVLSPPQWQLDVQS